jgi:hypothetical protein
MAIVNRRNAFVGYVVTRVVKWAVKQKAAAAARSPRVAGAAAGALAAIGGAVLFWKKTRSDDGDA